MAIVNIHNLDIKDVQATIAIHLAEILQYKLASKTPPNSQCEIEFSQTKFTVNFDQLTLDTGIDDTFCEQNGIEPLSSKIAKLNANNTLRAKEDALVAHYLSKRRRELTFLTENLEQLSYLLGISSKSILFSKEPSREAICSGKNLPHCYVAISSTVSFREIEDYMDTLAKKEIPTECIIGERAHYLSFNLPLQEVLSKLETKKTVKPSETVYAHRPAFPRTTSTPLLYQKRDAPPSGALCALSGAQPSRRVKIRG